VGHFFRILEIARAMDAFEVILVTGGAKVNADLPRHIRHFELPGLMMDESFSSLHSIDPEKTVENVKSQREKLLLELVKLEKPDIFFIELYPFGRRAFRFELVPVLELIKKNQDWHCKVICSLRDILVEKENTLKYENRVIQALNTFFDAVLVHSDPELIRLEDTFAGLDRIKVPIVYTGFVTPVPDPGIGRQIRRNIGMNEKTSLIVASAGGGNVGAELLKSTVHAFNRLAPELDVMLNIYTGPYMDRNDKKYLFSFADKRIKIEEFTPDFVSLLGTADLSISMAGYNTCMNIVAAGVPALVFPFARNREQRQRAMKLAEFAPIIVLGEKELEPEKFSRIIEKNIGLKNTEMSLSLNIHGAVNTVKWIRGNYSASTPYSPTLA